MQLTVPSFEFPRDIPRSVHFVGTPDHSRPGAAAAWAHDLDVRAKLFWSRRDGGNHDFSLLVGPALAALPTNPICWWSPPRAAAHRRIPGPIPDNARLASYLPFEWVLPKADVFVTNGGYGSVNQAMSFGIPLVTAGMTEDKADVNARVAWSGVGVNLATNNPTPQALRQAVRTVLDKPDYRSRAAVMAGEFSRIDTRSEILRIVTQTSHRASQDALPQARVAAADRDLRVAGRR